MATKFAMQLLKCDKPLKHLKFKSYNYIYALRWHVLVIRARSVQAITLQVV